jgi:serine/threonine protein kinase
MAEERDDQKMELPEILESRGGARKGIPSALRVAARPVLSEGEVLNRRFAVQRFLDRGGVAEVYEADDAESGERVALKLLRPDLVLHEVLLARFHREARFLQALSHPNVCRVLGFQETRRANGQAAVFIVLELLEGVSLEEIVAFMGRMTPGDALPIIRQVAAGLAAIHGMGIVHRDLKSGNVLLVKGEEGASTGVRAVLTDLGFARGDVGTEPGSDSSLTLEGQILGTIAYMAPEQLKGERATQQTDIYALGLILYEMVTGRLPFSATSSFVEAVRRLREPAPSPCIHSPHLPKTWETTILRCLEIDPKERFASAAEAVTSLKSNV